MHATMCQLSFLPPKKIKIVDKKTKKILQHGTIQLVRSNSRRRYVNAFHRIVIPLLKIAEWYLLSLPKDMFPRKMSSINAYFNNKCSYVSMNIYWHQTIHPSLPDYYWIKSKGKWIKVEMGNDNHGLHLHVDNNNYGMGAILIFGAAFEGFDQRYVTFSTKLPCANWSIVFGNYRDILHAVTKGNNGI